MDDFAVSHLEDQALLAHLTSLTQRDRRTTARILAYIAEIEERRAYAAEAFPTMFALLVRRLNYSESAAGRRIHAARVTRRVPALLTAVADGRLHLTAVILLAPNIDQGNADELIAESAHKSRAQVEELLARRFPRPDFAARLRRLPSRMGAQAMRLALAVPGSFPAHALGGPGTQDLRSSPTHALGGPGTQDLRSSPTHALGGPSTHVFGSSEMEQEAPNARPPGRGHGMQPDVFAPVAADVHNGATLPHGAANAAIGLPQDATALAGGPNAAPHSQGARGDGAPMSSIGVASAPPLSDAAARVVPLAPHRYGLRLTLTQETYDKLRHAQDLLRHRIPSGDLGLVVSRALDALVEDLESSRKARTSRPRVPSATVSTNPRHIPAHMRRAVWERDGGRCAYVSESGDRCESKAFLELDHVLEAARGGATAIDNLRLLCRSHNQFLAERSFGADFMRRRRQGGGAQNPVVTSPGCPSEAEGRRGIDSPSETAGS